MTFVLFCFCLQKLQEIADPEPGGQKNSYAKLKVDVSQHFAHLHGVLQNVENKMMSMIDWQMKHFARNRDALLNEVKSNEDEISRVLKVSDSKNFIFLFFFLFEYTQGIHTYDLQQNQVAKSIPPSFVRVSLVHFYAHLQRAAAAVKSSKVANFESLISLMKDMAQVPCYVKCNSEPREGEAIA